MLARIGGWLLYFCIVAAVIFVGWHEPLRYRFLSRAAINEIEHPATPRPAPKPATPKPGAWMSDSGRTSFDSGPRNNQPRAAAVPVPNPVR